MAGRPEKFTISYFPHYVRDSKTMFIIENKFGAEGYMFWFKLLELLCNSKNLYFDCNEDDNFEYLCAKIKVSATKATKILNNLSALNKIDKELWENKIIWCQDLVDNVSDVFKRRKSDIPERPSIIANVSLIDESNNSINVNNNSINESKKPISAPQSKLNKSKLNNIKEEIHIPKIKYADFVSMTPEEYQKLIDKYGETNTKAFIEKLSIWKGAKGKEKEKGSDYLKILNWVVDAVLNKGGGGNVSNNSGSNKRFSNERLDDTEKAGFFANITN